MTPYHFYRYEFVSPDPLYALIREELKSYFDSGSIDDTLFPLWTKRVLDKLGKGSLPIVPYLVAIEHGKGRLPDDFKGVREAWMCTEHEQVYTHPSSVYSLVTSTRLDDPDLRCNVCDTCENPPVVQAVYKANHQVALNFKRSHKLRRGFIQNAAECDPPCYDDLQSPYTYDLDKNFLKVNFDTGVVNILYYALEYDRYGYQMIPDNVFIQEAIEAFIKFKIFEMLYNQSSDETFNQTRAKKQEYEMTYLDKMVIAETQAKKETGEKKALTIKQNKTRFRRYNIR